MSRPDFTADTRLAVYGTLAPGRVNADQLDGLQGTWRKGFVRGHLIEIGWGANLGYPGLIPDGNGDRIEVQILESTDLPQHWARLDAFEGEGYYRIPIRVEVEDGTIEAAIYAVGPDALGDNLHG